MIDKNLFKQYDDLKKEIEDLQRRTKTIEEKLAKIRAESTVSDSVKGTRKDGTYGSIMISGFPIPECYSVEEALEKRKQKQKRKQVELQALVSKIESSIDEIGFSKIRRILRYRYIDGYTWDMVACHMGTAYTADSCRVAVNRYLEK